MNQPSLQQAELELEEEEEEEDEEEEEEAGEAVHVEEGQECCKLRKGSQNWGHRCARPCKVFGCGTSSCPVTGLGGLLDF